MGRTRGTSAGECRGGEGWGDRKLVVVVVVVVDDVQKREGGKAGHT